VGLGGRLAGIVDLGSLLLLIGVELLLGHLSALIESEAILGANLGIVALPAVRLPHQALLILVDLVTANHVPLLAWSWRHQLSFLTSHLDPPQYVVICA
jgi:hypothetical protein